MPMRSRLALILGVIVLLGVIAAGIIYFFFFNQAVPIAAMAINYVRYLSAPAGTLETETAPAAGAAPQSAAAAPASPEAGDWPSYNKTLTSNRFSGLNQINRDNAGKLKVLCTYDTGQYTGFTSGLLEVDGALIFVTEYDLFSIDPATCKENWRAHEDYTPATPQGVNRGAAYLDGTLFRGTQDGRVLAYDFKTGKRLWETTIADPSKGESAPAAPIAWNGLVFIGNAGGDIKGIKGRMYALDAKTGKIVWEFYLVPKAPGRSDAWTGRRLSARHVDLGQRVRGQRADNRRRDLDVLHIGPRCRPVVRAGRQSRARFRGRDAARIEPLFRLRRRARRQDRRLQDPLQAGAEGLARLGCFQRPGHHQHRRREEASVGRAEGRPPLRHRSQFERRALSGAGDADGEYGRAVFDRTSRSTSVPARPAAPSGTVPPTIPKPTSFTSARSNGAPPPRFSRRRRSRRRPAGQPWSGEASLNPFNVWGKGDPYFDWAGWTYAVDADTGQWKWRAKTNYPIQSGMTPTAGGVVFFGDMGGNFYALDTATGQKLWGQKIGGAVGGGVITYAVDGKQKVAVAHGLTEVLWPTDITTAKVSILGARVGPPTSS